MAEVSFPLATPLSGLKQLRRTKRPDGLRLVSPVRNEHKSNILGGDKMNQNEDYFVKRNIPEDNKKTSTASDSGALRQKSTTERRIAPSPKKEVSRGSGKNTNSLQKPKPSGAPESTKPQTAVKSSLGSKLLLRDYGNPGSIDVVFLMLFVLLMAFGAVMSFSASYAYADKKYGDSYYFVLKHLEYIAVGAVGILIVLVVPLKYYKGVTYIVSGAAAAALVLVLLIGETRGGAKRWIEIPGFGTFQPSELAKTAIVMLIALYMAKYGEKAGQKGFLKSFKYGMLYPGAIIGTYGILVLLERHFSGIIILGGLGIVCMLLGGTKWQHVIPIGLVAAGLLTVMILFTDYSSERIDVWLDPFENPQGSGWQTIQGLRAIGSGGIFGVGLGNSRQKFGYVSEPQNDFVFTIVCEELGFIGAFAVMLLFFLLVWRGFTIARRSPDRFTYLLVSGLMVKIALQVGLNIGVVTNSVPNTGISLPFFSSGGTSLLVQMAEIGMVLSVSRYSHNKK